MIPSIALLSIADLGVFGLAAPEEEKDQPPLVTRVINWLFCNTLDRHVKDKSQKAYYERMVKHHLHGMASKDHHVEGKRL